jgi:putative NADPH-quinone reductase
MKILVINGHPDPAPTHLCAALADAYARGAEAAGHEVTRLSVGALKFEMIRSLKDYQSAERSDDMDAARDLVRAAQHLVFVFPIWFGSPPGLLKGFFEQLMRYGYTLSSPQAVMDSLLSGKSARLIVTMGAPLPLYRLVLGGHGLSGLTRGLLWATGVKPIRQTLLGGAHEADAAKAARWVAEAEALGRRAQ